MGKEKVSLGLGTLGDLVLGDHRHCREGAQQGDAGTLMGSRDHPEEGQETLDIMDKDHH